MPFGVGRQTYCPNRVRRDLLNRMQKAALTPEASAKPVILVIEDEAEAREALGLILQDWGGHIIAGANERDFDAVDGRWSDIKYIIADFDLGAAPDGVTLAQRLVRRAPGARVLVLSGQMSAEAPRAAARAGYAFLPKPATAKTITAWLESA
jgi:DNA-binding NtrC family response regulator